ncbi:RagB/SusD family nutrient uptake outer membrane protein [Chitinophaga sedimenti]|uniref:RagB/SusD family nutrient uptake outer membrane protein n=1 Tax=Chitinophaga sedimenti TaxID=2033606 RepID=UPI0020032501|nr:RagB/SusD family nutrient uptake outer membrane protein [Chitinophaga sedimenti]MCK7558080.1 RagB/SusD family nutrient uptake outer membrane protein [Chitinophaga sedimenti]
MFEAIVTERQLELAFEGYRYVDLVRWGRAEAVLGPLGFEPNKNEVLPIPNNDVLVAGIKQNQNY